MNFKIEIKKKAKKFLLKLNRKDQEKLLRAIYNIQHEIITIMILNIGNRGDVYKDL